MNMMPYIFVARTHGACVNTPNFEACVRATSDNACVRACARIASNYPFAKLMQIAESVRTGRVRATSDKSDKQQNFKFL